MAKKTLDLLDNVGSSLLATKTVGEKPSIMKAKGLVIVLDRQLPDKMGGKSFGQGENSVALPSADTLFGGKPDLPAVDSQVGCTLLLPTSISTSNFSSQYLCIIVWLV